MSMAVGGLRQLHALHIQLRQVKEKLEGGPRKIKSRQLFTQRRQEDRDAQKQKLIELKKGADQKSLQLKSNEAKIVELKVKLNAASSNREFDIIKGQIDADVMANSVLEDEILEFLEKIDEAQVQLGKLEQEVVAASAEGKSVADAVAASEPALREELASLETAIAAVEQTLPTDVRESYRRLVQAHGANGLAPVEKGICMSCNVSLLPQSRVEMNSGKTVFCKNCGRLLYLPE